MLEQLLVRPRIESDEWLEGYLARIVVANGLPRECRAAIHLQAIHPNDDLDQHSASGARLPALATVGRHIVPGWSCSGVRSRACFRPICWQQAPYYRSEWRLADSAGCWRHGCEYRWQCHACNAELDVVDVCAGACRRGHSLTVAEPGIDTSAWPRFAIGASDLTRASEEVLASYLLLTRLAARTVSRSRRKNRNVARSMSILIKAIDAPVVLGLPTVRATLLQLSGRDEMSAALHLILRAHRDELAQKTVLSSLPLWELAGILVRRGASCSSSIRDGLIDRHAVAFVGADGDLQRRGYRSSGIGASGVGEAVLSDSAHLQASSGLLRLREFDEWKARQAVSAEPVVQGTNVFMSPCELEDYLRDLSRVARPLAECREATVPLNLPQLWAGVRRAALIDAFDKMRSGLFSVWERHDRVGIARFYVGGDVLRRLRPCISPSVSAPTPVQMGLPLWSRRRHASQAKAS